MTLKEAKKILEKEFVEFGFHKSTEPFEFDESRWFVGEKPEVLDAFRVLSKEGYYISISEHDYDMRKVRLGRPTDKPSSDTPSTLNPALKEAASQFNDALLDEQGKKIEELTKEKTNLEDQITILDACKKHNENFGRKQIKRLGKEIAKLNGIIHDKNAVLADVAEELRLSKIREKNLTEVCQKYMKEIEELRKELADKVVEKIDAQALKSAESAESALAWKEKAGTYKDMALVIVNESTISSKEFEEYRRWANGYRFNPQLPDFSEEEEKKLTAKTLDFNAKCMKAARESINDVSESYAAKYAKSSLDDLKEKAYELFNAKAHNLGLVGSKDGNGIHDQMEDNTHPTEDNPEEVEMDEILEHVRKVLEEGDTVTTSYDKAEEGGDKSATIVQHRKSIVDLFKKIKRLWQE